MISGKQHFLFVDGYRFKKNSQNGGKIWWVCSQRWSKHCSASVTTSDGAIIRTGPEHNHAQKKNLYKVKI